MPQSVTRWAHDDEIAQSIVRLIEVDMVTVQGSRSGVRDTAVSATIKGNDRSGFGSTREFRINGRERNSTRLGNFDQARSVGLGVRLIERSSCAAKMLAGNFTALTFPATDARTGYGTEPSPSESRLGPSRLSVKGSPAMGANLGIHQCSLYHSDDSKIQTTQTFEPPADERRCQWCYRA